MLVPYLVLEREVLAIYYTMSEELVNSEQVMHKNPASSQQLHVHLVQPHSQDSEKKQNADSKPEDSKQEKLSERVCPVLTKKEMGRMIEMGLGRGVDATDASPWVSKSSFQVRRVTFDSVIGTEEGGALQSYEREISRYVLLMYRSRLYKRHVCVIYYEVVIAWQ